VVLAILSSNRFFYKASVVMVVRATNRSDLWQEKELFPQDIAEAGVYVMEARIVTREVLHGDGGAHVGPW
jgi:hypothetical protein